MHLDDETIEQLAIVARAAAAKAVREVGVPTWRPATVVAVEGRRAIVVVDGDADPTSESDQTTEAELLTHATPLAGARVMVRFAPPHGVFVDSQISDGRPASATRAILATGNLTRTATTWAAVGAALDLTLPARAGDWLVWGISAVLGPSPAATFFEPATLVGGAYVNAMSGSTWAHGSTTGGGAPGLRAAPTSGEWPVSGTVAYQVVAADLAAGADGATSATVRLTYRHAAAASRIFYALADTVFQVWMANLSAR